MDIKKITKNTEPRTNISGLTYENILKDVYDIIQDNSDYKDNWTDFISADGGRMVAELFAYVGEQLANRIDSLGNELFVDTTSDKEGLLRLLKLTSYKLPFPTSSELDLNIFTTSPLSSGKRLLLSKGIKENDSSLELTPNDSTFKKVSASGISYEIIEFNPLTNKYDYLRDITVNLGSSENIIKKAYQGETKHLEFTVKTNTNFKIRLTESPVERDSVSIFWKDKRIVDSSEVFVEFKEVDNFFGREAQTSLVPVYKLSNLGNGICEIEFPSSDNVSVSNPININDEIVVMYRITDGAEGNITTGFLEHVETNVVVDGKPINVNYVNITPGRRGRDEGTEEQIRKNIENDIRNSRTLITSDDYEYIYKLENPEIKDIKVFGEGNGDINAISEAYGYYVNPLNVWLFVLKNNKTFNELYEKDEENLTDFLNDINFNVFEENERKNENYQVKKGSVNNKTSKLNSNTLNPNENINGFKYNSAITDISEELSTFKIEPENPNESAENLNILTLKKKVMEGKNFDIENLRRYAIFNSSNDNKFYNTFTEGEGFSTVIESVETSISAPVKKTYDGEKRFKMIVEENEERFVVDVSSGSSYTTIEAIISEMNNTIRDYANYVLIKEDINSDGEILDKIVNGGSNTGSSILTINNNKLSFTVGSNVSYKNLLNELNNNTFGYYFLLEPKNDCYNLVVINRGENSLTISGDETAKEFLDIETFPLKSHKEIINYSFLTNSKGLTEDLINTFQESSIKYLTTEGEGNNKILKLSFGNFDSIFIESNSTTKDLFNITEGDNIFEYQEEDFKDILAGKKFYFTFKNKLIKIEDKKLKIRLSNPREKLGDCFLTILGETNEKITLGSYYNEINNNEEFKASNKIKNLLKREKINFLFPTKFNTKNRIVNDEIDDYGSNYEVKVTKNKAIDIPFSKIDSSDFEGARIDFSITNSFEENKDLFFRIKLNGEDFCINEDIARKITPDEGEDYWAIQIEEINYPIKEENGYLSLNLKDFSNKSFYSTFLKVILKAFENRVKISNNKNGYSLETKSKDGFASLDILASDGEAINKLTGFNNNYKTDISTSKLGYFDLKPVNFKFFRLNKYSTPGGDLTICWNKNGEEVSETFNMPYIEYLFAQKVNNNTPLSDIFIYSENRLILKSRKNGDYIKLKVDISEGSSHTLEEWKKTFPELEREDSDPNKASCKLINDGDYYINRELTNSDENVYYFNILKKESIPYGNLYFHMIEDNKPTHKYSSSNFTDEYLWENSIAKRKTLSVNHIYKQPRFRIFDVHIKVVFSDNLGITTGIRVELSNNINKLIKEKFNIYNSEVGGTLTKESIRNLITEKIPGVKRVSVEYLGEDMSYLESDVNEIACAFDEKLIPSVPKTTKEKYLDSNNNILERSIQIHGIKVEVLTEEF